MVTISTQIPTWLETPADSIPQPPVATRPQELPFGQLTWENFERLCLRLAKLESDVEHCQLYGVRGQKQQGIDLYARRRTSNGYSVYQCKRELKFNAGKIRSAVERFRDGKWFKKADVLILCTTDSLTASDRAEEVEAQTVSLKESGITFIAWDCFQLSLKLKVLPSIVDDFFGREWALHFCGEEVAKQLGRRLDAAEVAVFRRRLGAFYRRLFSNHDPGLPSLSGLGDENPLAIEDRFVLPDVDDRRIISPTKFNEPHSETISEETTGTISQEARFRRRGRSQTGHRHASSYEYRQSVDKWLATKTRSVILGGPGTGKSSLLRFLVTDLLRDEPRLHALSEKWGQFLPVWVPFAYWTKKIATPETNDISLHEALKQWLTSWSEERLWPIVEQALNDERLLLFVDGFDEYTDESAARSALSRLQVFAEQRDLPTVATSRPQGFEQLNMQTAGWEVATLSDFSRSQQEELAHVWFKHWATKITGALGNENEALELTINKQVESLSNDLKNSSDLRELAKVPLLLSLLIAHKLHDVQLPPTRFKAYESLIEHLLFTHPKKRRLAASLTEPSFDLSNRDMKLVFAYLAFRVHQESSEGIFSYDTAWSIVIEYLKDTENGFGLEIAQSRKISQELLQIGENTLGLIVKKSHDDLGFFHRTFQEYLAATHMSAMALDEQLAVVQSRCIDPRWREPILGLLHLTSRSEDVKKVLGIVKEKKANLVERFSIDLLLAEVAFGDFNCGVELARTIAKETTSLIEVGSWMPHRERLLHHALEGLRSTKVRDFVRTKLTNWFPDTTRWRRADIFREMGIWAPAPDMLECLWKGLFDEVLQNARAAGRALAVSAGGDEDVGKRVAEMAWREVDPIIRSVAIECLLQGWPRHARIGEILTTARKSVHPVLRLVAITGKIRRGEHVGADLSEMFYLGSFDAGLDYEWREDVARALVEGWSRSPEVKRVCLDALERTNKRDFDLDTARLVLVRGFPQDDDVGRYFARQLGGQYFHVPILYPRQNEEDFFDTLARNFQGHSVVAPAADGYFRRNLERDYLTHFNSALVARSPSSRDLLLSDLDTHARAIVPILLKGWGMEAEVGKHLTALAFGPNRNAAFVAEQIPSIISDKAMARARLLELLRDSNCADPDSVLAGLKALGDTCDDTEVVDLVLSGIEADAHVSAAGRLIRGYPHDPRVRHLAKREFSEAYGSLDAIASVYSEDVELRELLIRTITPLPDTLRMTICTRISEGLGDDEFALGVLGSYDRDHDSHVKAEAAIGYYNRLQSSGRETESAILRLDREIRSEYDLGAARQAAFCGLVILRRLDVMKNAQLSRPEDRETRVRVPVTEVGELATIPFLKTLLQNWDYVREVFNEEFWFRFASHAPEIDSRPIWRELCLFADEYAQPRDEAIAFLESRKGDKETLNVNVFGFLERALPKSRLLLDYCISALGANRETPHYSSEEALLAVELLGKHFAGDVDALQQVMTLNKRTLESIPNVDSENLVIPENFILALCEGWPRSDEMRHLWETLRESQQRLTYRTHFQLASLGFPTEELFRDLRVYLRLTKRRELLRCQTIARFIVRRLKGDEELSNRLLQHLRSGPNDMEKTTFPRLIALGRGPGEVREWCVEEIGKQLDGSKPPDVGVDLVEGRFRSVVHSLLDAINVGTKY